MDTSKTRLIAVDIETDMSDPKGAVEQCEPFLLGIKCYRIESQRLVPEEYTAFQAAALAEGVAHIARLPGLIVGYNLFGFDYVVLRALLKGTTIVERTVDVLLFLRTLSPRPRSLRLQSVCTALFGEGKLELGGDAVTAWSDGRRDLVLRYNERDCDLIAKLWLLLVNADTVTIGKNTFPLGDAERKILVSGRQFANYRDWLSREFRTQSTSVRKDPFIGLNVNPIDLAQEFDRFVCATTGNAFYSRLIPASDYPSGEDTASLHCPVCGEYLADSPYVFKGLDRTRGAYLPASTEADALWSKVAPELVALDVDPHFECIGVPRSEGSVVRLADWIGISANDFERWIRQVRSKDLQIFVPQYEQRIMQTHRRSLRAEEEYALKIGAF